MEGLKKNEDTSFAERQSNDSEELDELRKQYDAAVDKAKGMLDERACPDSMWDALSTKLVDLGAKMNQWHEAHAGLSAEQISSDDAAEYRKLDDDMADIVIRILPREAGFDEMSAFYDKMQEAAKYKAAIGE